MCRSIVEGGRRCHHADDSNARALRRANARLKAGFKDNVTSTVNGAENPSTGVLGLPVKGSVDVKKAVEDAKNTRESLKDMMSQGYTWNGEVAGEKFDSYEKAYKTLIERLEFQITLVGASVAADVETRTGVSYSEISEYSNSHKEELQAELDRLITLEAAMKQEAGNKFGVSGFLSLDSVRLLADREPDNVEAAEFVERLNQLSSDTENVRREYYNFNANKDPKLFEMWNANRDMLKTVLSEHRAFGGIEVKVDDSSDKKKAAILQNVVDVYPTDWIAASNENTASLKVKKTVGRAHYNRNAGQAKIVPSFVFVSKEKDFEPDGTRFQSDWIKIEPDEDGLVDYVNPATGHTYSTYVSPSESLWIKPAWEYANQWSVVNGQPRGRGWELATVKESVYNPETGSSELKEVTVWRRQAKEKQYIGESKAELLIDGAKGNLVKEEGYDSAVHEFAHRVEDSDVPFLREMQDAFYRRRTEVDGVPMEKIRLYKGKNEFAIPDSFTADYMGKRYEQVKHFEILSTGMEAVFGNAYGGLVGVGGKKVDHDMRNFILGLLATL